VLQAGVLPPSLPIWFGVWFGGIWFDVYLEVFFDLVCIMDNEPFDYQLRSQRLPIFKVSVKVDYTRLGVFDLGEVDMRAEGVRVRACVKLSPRASLVWDSMPRAEKVRVAGLFSEIVLYYHRTKRLPVASLDTLLKAVDIVTTGFEACLEAKTALEKAVEKAEAEIRRLEAQAAEARRHGEEADKLRQTLQQAQQRIEQLEATAKKLNAMNESLRRRLERLKFICRDHSRLQTLARTEWEKTELETLCQQT